MEYKIKILRKEKDGVTLMFDKPQKISWDDFNNVYVINPKNIHQALFNSEYKKKADKLDSLMSKVAILTVKESKSNNASLVGELGAAIETLMEQEEKEGLSIDLHKLISIEIERRIQTLERRKAYEKIGRHPERRKSNEKEKFRKPNKGAMVLADNPVLLELKRNMKH